MLSLRFSSFSLYLSLFNTLNSPRLLGRPWSLALRLLFFYLVFILDYGVLVPVQYLDFMDACFAGD